MRPIDQQKILDNMTQQEKIDRTSLESFKARGSLLSEYQYRYLTKNEFPHQDRGRGQLVLWRKNNTPNAYLELEDIVSSYINRGFWLTIHDKNSQSIPMREHWHIYPPKQK